MNGPTSNEPDPSTAFRVRLKRESEAWLRDGLIDPRIADALSVRYRFADLTEPSMDVLVRVLVWIGSITIAAGVITFVAAHWGAIPPVARFALVFGVTFGAYALGWALYQRLSRMTTAAHAATAVGAIGFGATIALGAQLANADVSLSMLYLLWGLGLTPLAFMLPSLAVSLVALAALTIAGGLRVAPAADASWTTALAVAAAAALLAFRLRKPWFGDLARLSAAIAFSALLFDLAVGEGWVSGHDGTWTTIAEAFAVGAILLTGRSRLIRAAGNVVLLALPFVSAYWSTANWIGGPDVRAGLAAFVHRPPELAAVGLAALFAIVSLSLRRDWRIALPALGAFAIGLVPYLLPMSTLAVVLAENAAFALPAVAWLRAGLRDRDRAPFLAGVLLLIGIALARFAEYDTGLIVKSIAFLSAGALLIAAAIGFNRLNRSALHVA